MSSKLQLAPLGTRFWFCTPGSEREFDTAFAVLVEQRVRALLIGADLFFTASRERLVALAARHAIPAIYELRDYTVADGLMSYGTNIADAGRQAWLEETAKGEFDSAGRLLRINGLTRDITERKELEDHKYTLISELDHRVITQPECPRAAATAATAESPSNRRSPGRKTIPCTRR
jgi:hypothetical protein